MIIGSLAIWYNICSAWFLDVRLYINLLLYTHRQYVYNIIVYIFLVLSNRSYLQIHLQCMSSSTIAPVSTGVSEGAVKQLKEELDLLKKELESLKSLKKEVELLKSDYKKMLKF